MTPEAIIGAPMLLSIYELALVGFDADAGEITRRRAVGVGSIVLFASFFSL